MKSHNEGGFGLKGFATTMDIVTIPIIVIITTLKTLSILAREKLGLLFILGRAKSPIEIKMKTE